MRGGGGTRHAPTNLILRLYDLGSQTAPNPIPTAGAQSLQRVRPSVTYANQPTGCCNLISPVAIN